MKKKWVIINIETKSREFHSKLLLAYFLVNEGYGVIFSDAFENFLNLTHLPKGLFFNQNILPSKQHILKFFKKKKFKIYTLDEEGFVFLNEKDYLKRICFENLKIINKFLCNGKDQYKIMFNNYPDFKDKFVITGNPRFDILNPKYDLLEKTNINKIKKKYTPFFLIVSNFSLVNFYYSTSEKKLKPIEMFKKAEYFKNIDDYIFYNLYLNYSMKNFNKMKSLIEFLSINYPEYKIIIRPHPSENIHNWKDFALKLKNVEVVYKYDLNSWLKSAECVIQNSCTSSIESLLLEVPCISYRPYINEMYDQPLPNKVSMQAKTHKDVKNILDEILQNKKFLNKYYQNYKIILSEYIEYGDVLSALKITNLIKKENIDEAILYPFKLKILYLKNDLTIFFKFIFYSFLFNFRKIFLRSSFRYNKTLKFLWGLKYRKNKCGNFSEKEISNMFAVFNKNFNKKSKKNIKIKKIRKNFFIFTN